MTSSALRLLTMGLLAVAVLGSVGCANSKFATDTATLIDHGCKGSVTVSGQAGSATGLSPGSASIQGTFTASCDHANAVPNAPGG